MPPPIPRSLTRGAHTHLRPLPLPHQQQRPFSSSPQPSPSTLLSTPTWSVRSLLPPSTPNPQDDPPIPPATLHHLLRLSALPSPPSGSPEEAHMLSTLRAQLHFVRAIQQVDTSGVEPLYAIRDETRAGRAEASIGLGTEAILDALAGEEAAGRCGRPRRRRDVSEGGKGAGGGWDVLGQAKERAGKYFVVRSGKPGVEGGE